ncbi:hypothetical protein [Metapseudomonas otitidis]|uniref:hypothetical protein n=1 Tax=Metapseudomonas otitidis TaxID=319939 RepID=UPI0013F68B5A|nr:hypothetical protein [Pseudomonas otitidis]
MMSLWSLLAPRAKPRHFALLDEAGICRGVHLATQAPACGHWVEVNEPSPSWIGQPLPARARLPQTDRNARRPRALAA